MDAATAVKEGGGGVGTEGRRVRLSNDSSPQTRLIRQLIIDTDVEVQRQVLAVCELLAPDEWHWTSARRQLLGILNDASRNRLQGVNALLDKGKEGKA